MLVVISQGTRQSLGHTAKLICAQTKSWMSNWFMYAYNYSQGIIFKSHIPSFIYLCFIQERMYVRFHMEKQALVRCVEFLH